MRTLIRAFLIAAMLILAGCMGTQPVAPRIDRLPEGALGPFVPAVARPLSLAQVAEMARSLSPANVIIQSLRDSRASYAISSAEASELSSKGVPYEVIEYLRWGERRYAPVAAYPYASYSPGYFYSVPAYAPVVPGFYHSHGGNWPYRRYPGTGISLRFGFRR